MFTCISLSCEVTLLILWAVAARDFPRLLGECGAGCVLLKVAMRNGELIN